jgi:hypothetical protein
MITRAAFLSLTFLAGCAAGAPEPAPDAGAVAAREAAPDTTTGPSASAGPSDWALAIVGTPFVFAFRTVVCAATAVVAGPTAGLLAFSEEREAGLAYLRDGLAQNCGPPYAVAVPVAAGYRTEPDVRYAPEPDVRYAPEPDVRGYPQPDIGKPRPLTSYGSAALASP